MSNYLFIYSAVADNVTVWLFFFIVLQISLNVKYYIHSHFTKMEANCRQESYTRWRKKKKLFIPIIKSSVS
jgi:hypothetical protein